MNRKKRNQYHQIERYPVSSNGYYEKNRRKGSHASALAFTISLLILASLFLTVLLLF